jgi:regulator of protease activity HflC (stomatin/prohibitin superfamily)
MDIMMIVAIGLIIFAVVLLSKGFVIVKQSECMIIEKLGSFSRTLTSGFNLIIPFVEEARQVFWIEANGVLISDRIDLRETVLDIPEQSVITRDNVSISIDALLYLQIVDPVKATYEIANLPLSVAQLTQTTLRNVIGELDLDESLVSRDTINSKLKMILDEATDKWGTKVNRVELRNITPPRDIQQAMEKQMQAERERRAKVLEADGDRQARITRSEGQRQEQINIAEGDRDAQIKRALGEAEAIKEVAEAQRIAIEKISSIVGNPEMAVKYILTSKYVEEFGNFVQKEGDKVFVPYEATTSVAALGSLKEMLSSVKK